MTWPAPAKLNLMLRILGRRSDGYHRLQTVFQFLDLCDGLSFRRRNDGVIHRLGEVPGVPHEDDLVVQAARRLQQQSACPFGADIVLEKRVPMGAGLGGGSSDAATTLMALNRVWGCGLSIGQLASLGLSLGADVPVFVHGRSAWAEGVGEQLFPLDLPEPWYLVLVPPCQISTAEIFAAPDLTRDSDRMTISEYLAGRAANDCQSVVCRRYPLVADALDWLGRFAAARLTGTGAALFASFEREEEALEVSRRAPGAYRVFVARGSNRSPLRRPDAIGTGGGKVIWGVAKR